MGGFFSRIFDYFDPTPDNLQEDERQRLEREAFNRSFGENAENFGLGLGNFLDKTVGVPKRGLDLLSGYTTETARVTPENEVESPTIGQLVGPTFVPPVNEEKSVFAKALDVVDPVGGLARKIPHVRQLSSRLAEKGIDLATDPNFPGLGKLGRLPNAALGAYFATRGAKEGGREIGEGLSKIDQGNSVEAVGDIGAGLFDIGMAGLGGKHLGSELTPLARRASPFGDVNLTLTSENRNITPLKNYKEKISELRDPDRFMEGSLVRANSEKEVASVTPEILPNDFTGFKEFESQLAGNPPFHTYYEGGQRQGAFAIKPYDLELATIYRDHSAPAWKDKLDVSNVVPRMYSRLGEMAETGNVNLAGGPLNEGSVRARGKIIPSDTTLEMAIQAAKSNPERLASEAEYLPGTSKFERKQFEVEDVTKGIRDITSGNEFSPEAQAVRHTIDKKWENNPEAFAEAYGDPEQLRYTAMDPKGNILTGTESLQDFPILTKGKELVQKLLPEGTPSSQRGAVGDIGPLNKFEDSQAKKYGKEWRTKQTPEEAAFHQKLLSGSTSFKTIESKAASTETSRIPEIEEVGEVSKAEEVSEVGIPKEKVDRLVQRPDGSKIRIETTDDNQIRVTKTRKDGSVISVEEGPDFDSLKESYEVFEPSKETPLSVIREKHAEREKAFRENIRLRDKLTKAQDAEEVKRLTKEMKDNLLKTQDPSKPTESDTFGEGWSKLDSSGKALEGLNILRSLKSSLDTPILRQGRVVTFNNPKVAWEAARKMAKVAFSKEQFDTLHNDIAQDPVYRKYSDLGKEFVPDMPGVSGLREEAFPSPLAEKIPLAGKTVVAPSDRAYTGFMNSARLGHWKKNVERLERKGLSVEKDPEVFQDLARVTNLVTFRADTKNKIVKSIAESNIAGNVFYSPRNKMSQIQILKNMLPFGSNLSSKGGLASPKNILRKQISQTWAVNAAIYGTLAYAGLGTIEKDPESSDFLKFKVGNKRYNPWLGTNQIIRAALLMATGKSKTLSGKDRNVSPEEVAGREIRKSLAPGPGLLWDLYSGKNVVGEKVREKEDSLEKQIFDSSLYALKNGTLPMSIDDILREYKQSGLASSIGSVTVPGLAGENVSVYEESSEKPPSSRKRKKKYQLAF